MYHLLANNNYLNNSEKILKNNKLILWKALIYFFLLAIITRSQIKIFIITKIWNKMIYLSKSHKIYRFFHTIIYHKFNKN